MASAPRRDSPSASSVGVLIDRTLAPTAGLPDVGGHRVAWVLATSGAPGADDLHATPLESLLPAIPPPYEQIEQLASRVSNVAPDWRLAADPQPWTDALGVPLRRVLRRLKPKVDALLDWKPFEEVSKVLVVPEGPQLVARPSSSEEYRYWEATWCAAVGVARGRIETSPLQSVLVPVEISWPSRPRCADVLALSWQSRHAATLVPVIAELGKLGARTVVLDAAQRGVDLFPRTSRAVGVGHLTLRQDQRTVAAIESPMPDKHGDAQASAFANVATRALLSGGDDITQPSWRTLLELEQLLRRVIEETRPRVLLLSNDTSPLGFTAVSVARSAGVETVFVQHGVWIPEDISWRVSHADHVVVMSSREAELCHSWPGNDARRVHVLGQPRFDAHSLTSADDARRLLGTMLPNGLRRPGKVAVVATQPSSGDRTDRQVAAAIAAVRQLARSEPWSVVLAIHPAQPHARYVSLAEVGDSQFAVVVAPRETPLTSYLAAATVLLIDRSTSGLDAALLGVPVVEMTELGGPRLGLAAAGVALEAAFEHELAKRIAEAADPRSAFRGAYPRARSALLRDYRADGRSSARTAALVRGLV